MADRPPFNLLRAVFVLILVVVCAAMATEIAVAGVCLYGILTRVLSVADCRAFDLRGAVTDFFLALIALVGTVMSRMPPGGG